MNFFLSFGCGFALAIALVFIVVTFCRKKILDRLNRRFKSITRWLFITSQFFALLWVSTSYILAAYATFALEQPFPIETLSEQAIVVLLGTLTAKVVENIFEHNDGGIFGKCDSGNGDEEK